MRLLGLLLFISLQAQAMELQEYLEQVERSHSGLRAVKSTADAKEARKFESSLFFKPSFFLNGEYWDDQRPTNAPSFQGIQTIRHTLKTGLSQNLRTGTKASVSYNYYKTQIIGADQNLLPNAKFIDVAPQIELTQSLWRNFLGSEVKALESAQSAQVEASRFSDLFQYKQLMVQAQNAFWRLFFNQKGLKVQSESLDRARKLREWNAKRVRDNLADESDLLQAESNLQSREIEYQDTLTEVTTSLREFNSLRESNQEEDLLADSTNSPNLDFNSLSIPVKSGIREDVAAALAGQKSANANAVLGIEKNKPNFELYASYSINGRDTRYSDAYDQAMGTTRPFSIYGIRFTTPLDFGSMSDYKKAYVQESSAAEMNYRRKLYEVEREWEILSERFKLFKNRLKLSQRLVEIQEKKLSTEKRRFNQGRTTTFQVLQFEQDFANAQLLMLKNQRELLAVYNQLKLFAGVEYE